MAVAISTEEIEAARPCRDGSSDCLPRRDSTIGRPVRARTPATSASRTRRGGARALALQLSLIVGAALAYFGVRGLTEGSESTAVEHARGVLRFERTLGIDIEQGVQSWILGHNWIVTAANWVYIWGHWPVITITFFWLYRRHHGSFLLLRNAMFISGAIGLVIFMSYPVAPPRLMPAGFVDTVTELSTSYRVLQPPALVNKFAAVPSLHVGWNLLVGIMLYRTLKHPVARIAALGGPLLMASAVVLTANHYVFDVLAGSTVALAGLAAASLLACRPVDAGSTARRIIPVRPCPALVRPTPVPVPVRVGHNR